MALQIVAGSSGAGKTYYVSEEVIRESIAHPDQNFYVIVPEQFTMQTQKELAGMHPGNGLLNVDVLSFNRLAYRVFEETGGNDRPVLEDLGKILILQKLIAGHGDELGVLGRTLAKTGSVQQMKSLISELLQYRVRPEDLDTWPGEEAGASVLFSGKLRDIRCIYQAFCDYLADRYITTEEIPERLCGVIGRSEKIRESTVVLDGFTGFTPVQCLVVEKLLELCRKVTVVITADGRTDLMKKGGPHRLFHMSCQMAQKVTELAARAGCEILPVKRISSDRNRYSGREPLQFLEQNLFRFRRAQFQEKQENVRLISAADPAEEIRFIVSEIMRLVRTGNYRFRDFAIVTGDTASYAKEAHRCMENEGIPCFLDEKRTVLANPCVEFVRSAVELITRRFSYESVFRFLRCGLTDFLPEEIDRMENYCIALGIRGWKQYTSPWVRLSRNMKPEETAELNALRERFAAELEEFTSGMRRRNATVKEKAELLYHLMERHRIQEKLLRMQRQFEEENEDALAGEAAQIYAQVCALLDRLVEVLGEEKTGNDAFAELLDAGFSEIRVGLVPPGEDQVMIGDITRTRLKQVKVLFLCGVNEGIVPKAGTSGGILSEADREFLSRSNIVLSPDAREEMYQQRFYLYLTMTKPSDALYLSYSETSSSGEALMPSYLISTAREMFCGMSVQSAASADTLQQLQTAGGRLERIIAGLQEAGIRDPDPVLCELLSAASGDDERLRSMLGAAALRRPEDGIGGKAARALYGTDQAYSSTRLELYAACAFAHFARYGLRLSEREIYQFTPADMGTVMHAALERFAAILPERGLSWRSLTEEERNQAVNEAVSQVVHDYGNTILHSSARNEHLISRIGRILERTVWALQEQLSRGDFEPAGAEMKFRSDELEAMRLDLDGDARVQLLGRIDRTDICESGSDRYVRVIDYKTGSTALSLEKLYYGLQLQLMIYLNAAVEMEQKSHPGSNTEAAGAFYYRIQDPMVPPSGQEEQDILKELRMDGISRSEREILLKHDHMLGISGKSDVICAGIKKDGSLTAASRAEDKDSLDAIRVFAAHKARELAENMLGGSTGAEPYQQGEERACTWCPYRAICGFDERIPGYRYRKLKKMAPADAAQAMKDSVEKGGGPRG